MDVKTTLAVERFVRTAKTKIQIKNRLNIGIKSVVSLSGKNAIILIQLEYCLLSVEIQVGIIIDAAFRGHFAIILLIV